MSDKKPQYVVDDYLAIARRMEELAWERENFNKPTFTCRHCAGNGWTRTTTGRWRPCSACGNPYGKHAPMEK